MSTPTDAYITQTPNVRGGKPCIAGRDIKVQNIYIWHEHLGMNIYEIAKSYSLTLPQIRAALAYAFEHLDEIQADILESERTAEAIKNNR